MIILLLIVIIALVMAVLDTVKKVLEYKQQLYKNSLSLETILNMSEKELMKNGLMVIDNSERENPSIWRQII